MKTRRFDIAVRIRITQIAQICIDLNEDENIYKRAKKILEAITDNEESYVDVYEKGKFIYRIFRY